VKGKFMLISSPGYSNISHAKCTVRKEDITMRVELNMSRNKLYLLLSVENFIVLLFRKINIYNNTKKSRNRKSWHSVGVEFD
jgi:hypothetical protein